MPTLKGIFSFPRLGPNIELLDRQPTAPECVPTLLVQLPAFRPFLQILQGTFVYRVEQWVFLRQWGSLSIALWDTPFTFLLK